MVDAGLTNSVSKRIILKEVEKIYPLERKNIEKPYYISVHRLTLSKFDWLLEKKYLEIFKLKLKTEFKTLSDYEKLCRMGLVKNPSNFKDISLT